MTIKAGAIAKESMALFKARPKRSAATAMQQAGSRVRTEPGTKAQTVFLRVPARLAERIRAAVHSENSALAQRGLPEVLLFGASRDVSLPQWFARAGERELLRKPPTTEIIDDEAPSGPEPALNVNFDIDSSLAARCVRAIVALNDARAARQEDPVCLRAGRPSLPRWFLRAGLRELRREEDRPKTKGDR